ncbi:MAG: hypothetical protein H6996_09260 [Moraxellaceae bacterium]|nr:hypothetical protein [Pseudomonadales bacterium]MCB1673659.1 hypothetical protein [Pseudomonadales bacterium]MCP5175279.1 hypothetical protein [Moraxellaceae bacterium]MCP5177020.1 hypothetical protein [Moraxellaceae bacterium]HQV21600.1 hypothetical protein [Agitococcus sp.]
MKKDYPEANARLAEVAKSWAEGEISHDVWRKERRNVLSAIWAKKSDWESSQNRTLPLKKKASSNTLTMPKVDVPPQLAGAQLAMYEADDTEVSQEDVLFLAMLLLSMLFTAVFLLYWI